MVAELVSDYIPPAQQKPRSESRLRKPVISEPIFISADSPRLNEYGRTITKLLSVNAALKTPTLEKGSNMYIEFNREAQLLCGELGISRQKQTLQRLGHQYYQLVQQHQGALEVTAANSFGVFKKYVPKSER